MIYDAPFSVADVLLVLANNAAHNEESALHVIDRSSADVLQSWRPRDGFKMAHDVAVGKDGLEVFVGEVTAKRVWKLTTNKTGQC